MSEASLLLKARWVFPADQPPIEDGLIEISAGRITRIDSTAEADAVDLGKVAVIPGLVNAHTHLEFSGLTQPLQPPCPFEEWIHSLVDYRKQRHLPLGEIIRQGLDEAAQAGTTLLGEIATSEAAAAGAGDAMPRMVAFWEVLGLDDATIERRQAEVTRFLGNSHHADSGNHIRGLSPHAPYSIHPELLVWTIEQARRADVPVAMHLAETPGELELLSRGTGPTARMLREFGLWRDGLFSGGQSIMNFLEALATLKRVLVVHGNHLSIEEIRFLEQNPQFTVVYCPRTHAYFGHLEHPWKTLLKRGIPVALGTDSRASNPDLDLWRELLFLRASAPEVSPEILLRMATINGAAALGLSHETGTLTPGKLADLAIVKFGESGRDQDVSSVYRSLLHPQSRVVATMRAGRWLRGPTLK